MATLPAEEDEPQPTVPQRAHRAVVAPVERNRTAILLAIAAGAGSFAPDYWGAIIAMACVIAASDLARRR